MTDDRGGLTHRLIPAGSHTYSKGDDQFPSNAPRYLERGEGPWVWDGQGRKYLDWTAGLRSMSLGYGIEPVIRAATEQMWRGSNFGRPSYIETAYAERLVETIPCAEMVKFAKNGSTVTSAAVKLARAYTGRDLVAFCKDHPFFSYDDWFIGTTPCSAGIPSAFGALSLPFRYNDLASLAFQFDTHPGKIACVIMEAATTDEPKPGFLEGVQALCRKHGAVFILDEMITGFRWHLGGAQTYFGVTPDLATFGKGMANGFAVAALVGRRDIMDLGGLSHDRPRVFLISTTHGAENHALAAGLATLDMFHREPVVERMWSIGRALTEGLNAAAADAGVAQAFQAYGFPCSPAFATLDAQGQPSMALRTLFLQEMVRRGVIINYIAPGWSHDAEAVAATVVAARESLAVYARALAEGVDGLLEGPAIKPVFRPYN
ncbi:MAG: glutamate-1-semialdehyde 2,1-aminomutase [Alphaproteobacteria bacterium]